MQVWCNEPTDKPIGQWVRAFTEKESGYDSIRPFFFLGTCQDYKEIQDINHHRQKFMDCVANIPSYRLVTTWEDDEYHLDVCHATSEAHSKILKILSFSAYI